jgi:hypothetical protein
MEDYKKKYEEALDNFKKIKAANKYNNELVDFIEYKYPELKENEDERIRKECISIIDAWDKSCRLQGDYCEVAPKCIAWLEKQGEQKTAWSDEEEKILNSAISLAYNVGENNMYNWFQSLKERYTWKPSDEQMTYLSQVMDRNDYCGSVLYSLYQELKRL